MESQMVVAKKAKISADMICPLCNQFFRDAIAISECFHNFCRQCISMKLIDENLKHCPICKVDVGCDLLDNLREEFAIGKVIAPQESVFPISKPDEVANVEKNKKHSVIQILEKIAQNLSARRRKYSGKKILFLTESTPTCQPDNVIGGDMMDENHSQLQTFNMTSNIIFLNSSKPESSQDRVPKEISNDNVDLWKQRGVRWEPLDMVFEVANKILSPKPTIQEHVMPICAELRENDSRAPKCHVKNSSYQTKAASVHNASTLLASNSTKIRRSQRNSKRAK